jgi:hypothetical protein
MPNTTLASKRPFHVHVEGGYHFIRNASDGVLTGPFLADDVHRACNRWNDMCQTNLNAIKRIPLAPEFARAGLCDWNEDDASTVKSV